MRCIISIELHNVKRNYLVLWIFLDKAGRLYYHNAHMNNDLNPNSTPEEFIANLRRLMYREHLTYADLSRSLKLSVGTVQNWFYGKIKIPLKHRMRIVELLEEHQDIRLEQQEVVFLSVGIEKVPDTTLWCSAAGALEYDFMQARTAAKFTSKCAKWCSSVIMDKVGQLLEGLSEKERQALKNRLMEQDRKAVPKDVSGRAHRRKAYIMEVDGSAAAKAGKRVFIPVDADEYKHLLVRIAAEVKRKRSEKQAPVGELIISSLDAAAADAFNRDMERVCSRTK